MQIDASLIKALAGASAAVLVLLCLAIVAWLFKTYIQAKEAKSANDVVESAAHLVQLVESLTRDVRSLTEDVASLVTSIAVMQEQRSSLMAQTIPELRQEIASNNRRLSYVERDVTGIQTRLGMVSKHTPPLGVPVRIPTEDDQ